MKTNDRESTGDPPRPVHRESRLEVKRAIALGLGKLGDAEALDLLTAALRDPRSDQPLRDAALEAVEMIGSKKAAIALAVLLGQKSLSADRKPRVIAALGRLKDPSAVKPLLEVAQDAVGRRSRRPRSMPWSRSSRTKSDRRVTTVVRAVRPLVAGDVAIDVRNRAIAAAGALGDREAVPALIAASETPESRFEASLALAALPDIRAFRSTFAGLTDKNTDLRKASAAAIGNIRDQAAAVLDQLAARHELPPEAVPELRSIYAGLVPVTHGMCWARSHSIRRRPCRLSKPVDLKASWNGFEGRRVSWRRPKPVDARGQIDLGRIYSNDDDRAAYGYGGRREPVRRGKRRWSSAPTTR